MKQRNPIAVILLTFVTFGIYGLVWQVKTKGEMNRLGQKIPTAWLLIVPLVNIWWLWKYSEGVEQVTGSKVSAILAFVLLFVVGVFGAAIIQYEFNKLGDTPVAAAQPEVGPAAPGFGGSVAPEAPAAVAPAAPEPVPTPPVDPTSGPAPQA